MQPLLISAHFLTSVLMRWSARMQNYPALQKLFLKDLLGLTGCEISLNKMAAGSKAPFAHKHKENEELWIVLKGTGSIGVDGKEYPVKEGSFLKIAPAGVRTISATTDLEFLCIQTKAGSLTESTLTDAEIK